VGHLNSLSEIGLVFGF